MIDLPLRHGATGPAADESEPTLEPVATPRRPRRKKPSMAIWLIPAVLLAAILWWLFWPAPARIVTSETSLVFSTVRVEREGESIRFDLSNEGERTLRLEDVVSVGETAGDFIVSAQECLAAQLASGESCPVEVRFEPLAAGERRAAIEIRGNAGNSPFSLPLGGSAVAPTVGLAPESIYFGPVQVRAQRARLELTISNVGSAPLELGRVRFEGPQADEFDRDRRCPKTTLEPGEACTLNVRFQPSAAGERVAEMLIASDAPGQPTRLPLRGRGVWEGAPLDAEPPQLALGEQRVDRKSEAQRLRLVNRTDSSVEVASVELQPESTPFVVVSDGCGGAALVSGETCDVSIAVEPVEEGRLEASLDVGFADAGTLQIPLVATGVAPRLSIDPESVDFGNLRVGFEGGVESVALVNSGSATLVIEQEQLAGRDEDSFVLKDGCIEKTIGPGETCNARVAFRPTGAGGRMARLEITPSDELETLQVSLAGTGTQAGLAVDPGVVMWLSMQIGKAEDRRLTISNTGTARLSISGLRLVGDAVSDFAVKNIQCRLDAGLGPGQECVVTVRFAPSVAGDRRAGIEISHNGPESPFGVALRGSGEPQRPVFRASARDFAFGSVGIGSRSDIATLTVSNAGSAWLSLRAVALGEHTAADYELVAGTCDGVTALAPGGSCTVGVRFAPSATGARRGTLEIRHDADGSPSRIALAGVGS